ncbi:hypothetical protein, partial [Phenylobacterium sp.]|uniref:hypothetical protein n=1 Tax=Phenylobacterium sp. TaxID=1871053 RepID=UPI0025D92626
MSPISAVVRLRLAMNFTERESIMNFERFPTRFSRSGNLALQTHSQVRNIPDRENVPGELT